MPQLLNPMAANAILKSLPAGTFKTISKVSPTGSLQARKQSTGAVTFYWRYSIGEKSERVPIGLWGPDLHPKVLEVTGGLYSFSAAVRAAEDMATQHHVHRDQGGRPALVAAEAERQKLAAAEEAAASKHTLQCLMDDYCDHLKALGRTSHRAARSVFKVHVTGEAPAVARKPANQVTVDDVADLMRACIAKGLRRTSNTLRSYLRAAYQTAKSARTKPSIPKKFKDYQIVINPAAETEPDEAANQPDKNPLDAAAMQAYWRAIKGLSDFKGALLRLHLLTGAQRIEQLVTLKTKEVGDGAITIYDAKGRPGKPARPHSVPLVPLAEAALHDCKPEGEYALSTDGGKTHVAATTLSRWAQAVAEAAGIEDFQAKRLRSGVETLLASKGVLLEHRGRLQSHGVAGVQARHYDGWGYMPEKRIALDVLLQSLEDRQDTNVTPIRQKARA